MRAVLLAIVMCATSTSVLAQPYVEIKGVKEFTGRMIARPIQDADWASRGLTKAQMGANAQAAANAVAPDLIKFEMDIDWYIIAVPKGETENMTGARLMKTGLFEYVTPDWLVSPAEVTPNDPSFGSQWQHTNIQSTAAWGVFSSYGYGVGIAICDTGVSPHPDIAIYRRYNSVDGSSNADDICGHGTFCAGMAAATGNNGLGVVGAAWNNLIAAVRVTNDSTGCLAFFSNISSGARWAADQGLFVASCSWFGVDDPAVETTGQYCAARGCLLCWAAGNESSQLSAVQPDVLVVSATDSSDNSASFTNHGNLVDLSAPGVSVFSTTWSPAGGNGYRSGSGTSFSAPLVAGVAGMVKGVANSQNNILTAGDLQAILKATADDLGPVGWDEYYGAGRLNSYRAVLAVAPGNVWVDFGYLGAMNGTFLKPYSTLLTAATVAPNGSTIYIKPGTSSQTMLVNRPLTIKAFNGPVTIGH